MKPAGGGKRRDNAEADICGAIAVIHSERVSAWGGIGGNLEIQEKVRAGGADCYMVRWEGRVDSRSGQVPAGEVHA